MMDNNKIAAILINDLDSMVHYIEALPAHPRYTDALTQVQLAKQSLIEGRSDLHQSGMRERFAKIETTVLPASQLERRVPRPPKYVHPPWCVEDFNYFKAYNVSDDLADLFWTNHSDPSFGDYFLRPHVVNRGLPRVLQACYNLDEGNDSWTLCIQNCPAELRKLYWTFPLSYTPKEWDEGGIREKWYKKLYYWREDENVYRLRHSALAWQAKDSSNG